MWPVGFCRLTMSIHMENSSRCIQDNGIFNPLNEGGA